MDLFVHVVITCRVGFISLYLKICHNAFHRTMIYWTLEVNSFCPTHIFLQRKIKYFEKESKKHWLHIHLLLYSLVGRGQTDRPARPRPTALLPPRSNGKTRGCYCSCWAPDDGREDAQNMLSCTKTSSNKFDKFLHLVGWLIWICSDWIAQSQGCTDLNQGSLVACHFEPSRSPLTCHTGVVSCHTLTL